MEATDWQRPVTADGKLDVRIGDVWSMKNGPTSSGEVMTLPRGSAREIAYWTDPFGADVTTIHDLGVLLSRNGVPWDVPEDKCKGRWVRWSERPCNGVWSYCPADDYVAGCMIWLPDAAAPAEPATPDAPQPGERWEDAEMVYRPIHDGNGILRYTMPNGTSLFLHDAHGERGFTGYYYPAHGCKASAIRSDSLRYRNPHTGKCSTRHSPGDEIVRPTHVCFVKEAE